MFTFEINRNVSIFQNNDNNNNDNNNDDDDGKLNYYLRMRTTRHMLARGKKI